jgi:hypothetical protein
MDSKRIFAGVSFRYTECALRFKLKIQLCLLKNFLVDGVSRIRKKLGEKRHIVKR